jgi:hypothetical protein
LPARFNIIFTVLKQFGTGVVISTAFVHVSSTPTVHSRHDGFDFDSSHLAPPPHRCRVLMLTIGGSCSPTHTSCLPTSVSPLSTRGSRQRS